MISIYYIVVKHSITSIGQFKDVGSNRLYATH